MIEVPFEFLGDLMGEFATLYGQTGSSPVKCVDLSPCGQRVATCSVLRSYLTRLAVIRVAGELGMGLGLPLSQENITRNLPTTDMKWLLQNLAAPGRSVRRDR